LKGHIQLTTALKRLFDFEGYKEAVEDGLKVESNNADLCRMKDETQKGNFDQKFNETFEELQKGYSYTTKWELGLETHNCHNYRSGEERTEFVDMSKQMPCSYRKWDYDIRKYEKIILDQSYEDNNTSDPPPVEKRGITLRQLRAVGANILRRCEKEGWVDYNGKKLSAGIVTLYDVDRYIIRPYTKPRQLSFVTCLPSTAGPQPPRFFVSHWWGEPVVDFIKCLEQALRDFARNWYDKDGRRGGGLTADTPIWVCAYANNQHKLADDIAENPGKSGFTRAMRVAEGRTISILDKGAVVFTRIWCGYELFLTLTEDTKGKNDEEKKKKKSVWAVYTVHPHTHVQQDHFYNKTEERESVGIITGGAPADDRRASHTANRESYFPFELIKSSLTIKVEKAEASEKADLVRILNAIIGCDDKHINDNPPTTHVRYDEVNHAVIAAFVSTMGCMKRMAKEDDDVWRMFLAALAKGKKPLKLDFDFDEEGWSGMTAERVTELISHLPLSVSELTIMHANFGPNTNFGVGMIDAIINHVANTTSMTHFGLYFTKAGGDRRNAGMRLADAMATNNSIETLYLLDTDFLLMDNVEQWGVALTTNKTIETLNLEWVEAEVVEKLKGITKDNPKLKIDLY